jgi:hypothetical protein
MCAFRRDAHLLNCKLLSTQAAGIQHLYFTWGPGQDFLCLSLSYFSLVLAVSLQNIKPLLYFRYWLLMNALLINVLNMVFYYIPCWSWWLNFDDMIMHFPAMQNVRAYPVWESERFWPWFTAAHRLYRVPGFLSTRPNWVPPPPHRLASVDPPPSPTFHLYENRKNWQQINPWNNSFSTKKVTSQNPRKGKCRILMLSVAREVCCKLASESACNCGSL